MVAQLVPELDKFWFWSDLSLLISDIYNMAVVSDYDIIWPIRLKENSFVRFKHIATTHHAILFVDVGSARQQKTKDLLVSVGGGSL